MFQGRTHLPRGENLWRTERGQLLRRFNIALNDTDLAISSAKLDISPDEIRATNATYFTGDDKSRLRNRDWQERNRVYVRSMYILTALRVYLRIVEEVDKERTKREEKRRSVTGEKRSGYWNGEIYRSWESEAACDRRNALVTSNMQGRFICIAWIVISPRFIFVWRFLREIHLFLREYIYTYIFTYFMMINLNPLRLNVQNYVHLLWVLPNVLYIDKVVFL